MAHCPARFQSDPEKHLTVSQTANEENTKQRTMISERERARGKKIKNEECFPFGLILQIERILEIE